MALPGSPSISQKSSQFGSLFGSPVRSNDLIKVASKESVKPKNSAQANSLQASSLERRSNANIVTKRSGETSAYTAEDKRAIAVSKLAKARQAKADKDAKKKVKKEGKKNKAAAFFQKTGDNSTSSKSKPMVSPRGAGKSMSSPRAGGKSTTSGNASLRTASSGAAPFLGKKTLKVAGEGTRARFTHYEQVWITAMIKLGFQWNKDTRSWINLKMTPEETYRKLLATNLFKHGHIHSASGFEKKRAASIRAAEATIGLNDSSDSDSSGSGDNSDDSVVDLNDLD